MTVAGQTKLTAYELQVLIGTTISGCSMSPDRTFDLPAAWARLKGLGLIDRADGIANATPAGVELVASLLTELQHRRAESDNPLISYEGAEFTDEAGNGLVVVRADQHRREAEAGETIQWRGGHGGLWPDALGAAADALAEFEGGIDVHSDADARAALVIRAYIGAQPALAASPSSPASGVRVTVKPLQWKEFPTIKHDYGHGVWDANGPWTTYTISDCFESGWDATGERYYVKALSKSFATFDEAKSAAQADYESRILSALGEQS